MKYNAAEIIERLEQIRGNKLSGRELSDVEIWEKGRRLATTVSTEGWPVAVELLESYMIKSLEALASTDPKDTDDVVVNHAVTFVASRLVQIFKQDVANWVESSRVTPTVIKETIDSQSKLDL
jgi:hypothetical protein